MDPPLFQRSVHLGLSCLPCVWWGSEPRPVLAGMSWEEAGSRELAPPQDLHAHGSPPYRERAPGLPGRILVGRTPESVPLHLPSVTRPAPASLVSPTAPRLRCGLGTTVPCEREPGPPVNPETLQPRPAQPPAGGTRNLKERKKTFKARRGRPWRRLLFPTQRSSRGQAECAHGSGLNTKGLTKPGFQRLWISRDEPRF